MIYPGLVSITFRQLSPREILDLACRAGIQGVEWGGDVHVPHGDLEAAREVGRMTREAGLENVSYGSYYQLGAGNQEGLSFEVVSDTALALETKLVRVWAGDKGSADADEAYRKRVAEESLRLADMAAVRGITIAYEWHIHTLTDTFASAAELLKAADRDNIKTLWQPAVGRPAEECEREISSLLQRLSHLHVYHWQGYAERRPLSEGAAAWREYFRRADQGEGDRFALLEFTRDDAPHAFLEDAKALRELLQGTAP